jgi:hypothetical protein
MMRNLDNMVVENTKELSDFQDYYTRLIIHRVAYDIIPCKGLESDLTLQVTVCPMPFFVPMIIVSFEHHTH